MFQANNQQINIFLCSAAKQAFALVFTLVGVILGSGFSMAVYASSPAKYRFVLGQAVIDPALPHSLHPMIGRQLEEALTWLSEIKVTHAPVEFSLDQARGNQANSPQIVKFSVQVTSSQSPSMQALAQSNPSVIGSESAPILGLRLWDPRLQKPLFLIIVLWDKLDQLTLLPLRESTPQTKLLNLVVGLGIELYTFFPIVLGLHWTAQPTNIDDIQVRHQIESYEGTVHFLQALKEQTKHRLTPDIIKGLQFWEKKIEDDFRHWAQQAKARGLCEGLLALEPRFPRNS